MPTMQKEGELSDKRKDVLFKPSEWERVEKYVKTQGAPYKGKVGTFIHDVTMLALEETQQVPLVGYMPEGASGEMFNLPGGASVKPPFEVTKDSYAVLVLGGEQPEKSNSDIPSNTYAIFAPVLVPPYGAIVHVEWSNTGFLGPNQREVQEKLNSLTQKLYRPSIDPIARADDFSELKSRMQKILDLWIESNHSSQRIFRRKPSKLTTQEYLLLGEKHPHLPTWMLNALKRTVETNKRPAITWRDVEEHTGLSERSLIDLSRIAKLSADEKDTMRKAKLSEHQITRLAEISDPTIRAKILTQVIAKKLSGQDIQTAAKEKREHLDSIEDVTERKNVFSDLPVTDKQSVVDAPILNFIPPVIQKYLPQSDGTVRFQPLNRKQATVEPKEEDFVIRGTLLRVWHGT